MSQLPRNVRPPVDALLDQVARGSEAAFAELYDLVAPRIYGVVLRVVRDPAQSEEVAQEALVEIWRTASRFDPARGSATSWMFTIAHRPAVDGVRPEEAGAGRIRRLAVMGGAFAVAHVHGMAIGPRHDHNLNVDPAAAERSLGAGIPTLYVPLDVTARTFLTTAHRDALARGDDLCRALARMIDVWAEALRRTTHGRLPDDHVAALHDPLAVACLVDSGFVTTERLPVTVALRGGRARTFVDPVCGEEAEVVRSVDARAFADWLVDTLLRR